MTRRSAICDDPAQCDYFGHLRHDVLEHVPDSATSVLSIGCGSGRTEAELVSRGVKVTGIEVDPLAAAAARARGITVLEGDACELPRDCDGTFDCLIYADVLEHVADPLGVLERHVKLLSPFGRLIISVPNFRNYSVFWQLFMRGRIQYVDAGILDRTHLRITTAKMVRHWMVAVGLIHVSTRYILARRRDRLLSACSAGALREFVAQQVIVVGARGPEL